MEDQIRATTSGARRTGRRLAASAAIVGVVVLLASACVINGTWTALPAPAGAPTVGNVECVSATWCAAPAGGSFWVWDGTAWTSRGALPGSPGPGIRTYDCLAVDRCLAFVDRSTPTGPDEALYLMLWDGTTWTDAPGLAPEDAFLDPPHLSCGTDGCVAATADDVNVTWDGTTVTVVGWQPLTMTAMDCVTRTDCLGIDADTTIHWNGTTWAAVPGAAELDDETIQRLSCPSSTARCVAVATRDFTTSLTMVWDGAAWTETPLPSGVSATISDVDCVASFECVAVGIGGAAGVTLTFNGSSWFVAPTPPGGATARYSSVDCLGTACLATGRTAAYPAGAPLVSRYAWTYP